MIIAIDPGTSYCGISVSSLVDGKQVVHETVLVNGTRKPKDDLKIVAEKHNMRLARIINILREFKALVEKYKDDLECVVVELPFYSSRTPMAFEPIVQVNALIGFVAYKHFDLKTIGYEPRTIKVDFAGTGGAKKEHMREAFYHRVKTGQIILPEEIPMEDYVEHVIDSIAVGHTYNCRKGDTDVVVKKARKSK